MGGRIGDAGGGILGLHRQLIAHGEAVHRDLFVIGRSLDELGHTMSWRDLGAFLRWAPPESAYARSLRGDAAEWDLQAYLLALIADGIGIGNWQRSGKKSGRPKPLPRPNAKNRIGTTSVSMDRMDQLMGISPRTT